MLLNLRQDNGNLIILVAYVRRTWSMSVSFSFSLLFQKHYKHNVFNPFRTIGPVMFNVFHTLAAYVDTSGIHFNMN